MSLWKRIEQALWTGKIIKEYGPVAEGRSMMGKRVVSALIAHRGERDRFVIKASYVAMLAADVRYIDLDREGATRLKEALDDALTQMQ
jgi:hypothetical protein